MDAEAAPVGWSSPPNTKHSNYRRNLPQPVQDKSFRNKNNLPEQTVSLRRHEDRGPQKEKELNLPQVGSPAPSHKSRTTGSPSGPHRVRGTDMCSLGPPDCDCRRTQRFVLDVLSLCDIPVGCGVAGSAATGRGSQPSQQIPMPYRVVTHPVHGFLENVLGQQLDRLSHTDFPARMKHTR